MKKSKPKVGVIKLKNGSKIYVSTSESEYKKVKGVSENILLDEDDFNEEEYSEDA